MSSMLSSQQNEQRESIFQAIQALKIACELYGETDHNSHSTALQTNAQQNFHGIALAKFHLGYLYLKYESQLEPN